MNISEAMNMEVGTQFKVEFKSDRECHQPVELVEVYGDNKFRWVDGGYVSISKDLIEAEFIPIVNSVTFDVVLNSDCLCKVEHKLFTQKEFTQLGSIIIEILNVYDSAELKQIFREGTWYIKN